VWERDGNNTNLSKRKKRARGDRPLSHRKDWKKGYVGAPNGGRGMGIGGPDPGPQSVIELGLRKDLPWSEDRGEGTKEVTRVTGITTPFLTNEGGNCGEARMWVLTCVEEKRERNEKVLTVVRETGKTTKLNCDLPMTTWKREGDQPRETITVK